MHKLIEKDRRTKNSFISPKVIAILTILLFFTFSQEAWVGSYGDYVLPFKGFSVAADISVGSWSDHKEEAKAFANNQILAKAFMEKYQKEFQRVFDIGTRKGAPYNLHLQFLDFNRSQNLPEDYKIRFPVPSEAIGPSIIQPNKKIPSPRSENKFDTNIFLFTKPGLDALVGQKVIANFTLNQLQKDGLFHQPPKELTKQNDTKDAIEGGLSDFMKGFTRNDYGNFLHRMILLGYRYPKGLTELAGQKPATPTSLLAQLLKSTMEKREISDSLVQAVLQLQPQQSQLMFLMLLMTADSDWAKVTKAIEATVAKHKDWNMEWIQPMLKVH